MKKAKVIIFNDNDIFISLSESLIETSFIEVNPLNEIDTELKKYNLSKDSKLTYLGTVSGVYILSAEVDETYSNDNLKKVEINELMDKYASDNLTDYSALSLFIINRMKVKNITKNES